MFAPRGVLRDQWDDYMWGDGGSGGGGTDPNDGYGSGGNYWDIYGPGYLGPGVGGDPLSGTNVDPGGYYPGDNGVGPGMGGPGFQSPTGWVPNPGYDPSQDPGLTMGDPTLGGTPLSPYDPGSDPVSGGGVPGDPYNLGDKTPTFVSNPTGVAPSDPPSGPTQIGQPPDAGSPTQTPFPSSIGNGIQAPPNPSRTPSGLNTGYNPVTRPTPNPPPDTSPTPNKPPPGRSSANQPPRAPSSNVSIGLGGMPPISSNLPGDQKFTYQPISIARQDPTPNPPPPPNYGQGQQGQQGQSKLGALAKLGANYFGVPTSLKQLEQQWGIPTKNPYDSGGM